MIEVTQSARDAAADVWRDYVAKIGECIVEKSIRKGGMDDGTIVQAFAAAEQRGMIAVRDAAVKVAQSMGDSWNEDCRIDAGAGDYLAGKVDGADEIAQAIATMPMTAGGEDA